MVSSVQGDIVAPTARGLADALSIGGGASSVRSTALDVNRKRPIGRTTKRNSTNLVLFTTNHMRP